MSQRARCLGFLLLTSLAGQAQTMPPPPPPADPMPAGIDRDRFTGVVLGSAAVYVVSVLLLGKTWYGKHVPFHSFNDNGEWNQMDKVGHATTAYAIGRGEYELFRWSGVDERTAILTGGLISLLYQGTIEVFDGYSEGWGFSKGDLLANAAGVAFFAGQQYAWGEQKVNLRYGWRRSIYPAYRPELLGRSTGTQLLKDYNGQQYWLSVNLASVLPVGPDFPRWLNLDLGYSGSGMTGGHRNPPYFDASGQEVTFTRYRQFYLSPDVDLARLPGLGRSALPFIRAGQFMKIPAPSLEYNTRGQLRFHPLLLDKD